VREQNISRSNYIQQWRDGGHALRGTQRKRSVRLRSRIVAGTSSYLASAGLAVGSSLRGQSAIYFGGPMSRRKKSEPLSPEMKTVLLAGASMIVHFLLSQHPQFARLILLPKPFVRVEIPLGALVKNPGFFLP
jgi:hypothetical protein